MGIFGFGFMVRGFVIMRGSFIIFGFRILGRIFGFFICGCFGLDWDIGFGCLGIFMFGFGSFMFGLGLLGMLMFGFLKKNNKIIYGWIFIV